MIPLVIGLVPMYFGIQQLTRMFYERKLTEKGYFRLMFNRLNHFGEFVYAKPKDGKFDVKGGGFPLIQHPDYVTRVERMPTVVIDEASHQLVKLFNVVDKEVFDPKKFDGLTRHAYNIGLRTGMKKLQNIDKLLTLVLVGIVIIGAIVAYGTFGKGMIPAAGAA